MRRRVADKHPHRVFPRPLYHSDKQSWVHIGSLKLEDQQVSSTVKVQKQN